MEKLELLRLKAREYAHLKEMHDSIKSRLKVLGDELKNELPKGSHDFGDVVLKIQVRDQTKLDEDQVWLLLDSKPELHDWCTKSVICESGVEEAFLAGKISEAELRMLREPGYTVALVAEKVKSV